MVSGNAQENQYKVLPSPGLVIGFQYKGQLSSIRNKSEISLETPGITGLCDTYKTFKSSAGMGTVLVYFTETGFTHFASHPANELFNQSIALSCIFDKDKLADIEEKLALSETDRQRVHSIEQFFLTQLKDIESDPLIIEAVKLIYQSKGTIRIAALHQKLFISQSPFEKRFRRRVGATPKKFSSIVRFNTVVDNLTAAKSLTEACYENNFFDQAHFIKDFKQFTGETPENFKRSL